MRRSLACGLVALLCASATHVSAAVLTVDDFESYAPGQAIATGAATTPWLRFGAVLDNLYASSNATSLISGALSGRIPVGISTPTGSATVRRNYAAPTNLSAYATASVDSKSLVAGVSSAALQISVTNGPTSYVSTVAQPLTTTAATYAFALDPAAFTLADGTQSLAEVLATTTSIGFRISSTTGSTNETIAFDNFTLATAVPEPTTLAALGAASTLLLRRRRR